MFVWTWRMMFAPQVQQMIAEVLSVVCFAGRVGEGQMQGLSLSDGE